MHEIKSIRNIPNDTGHNSIKSQLPKGTSCSNTLHFIIRNSLPFRISDSIAIDRLVTAVIGNLVSIGSSIERSIESL